VQFSAADEEARARNSHWRGHTRRRSEVPSAPRDGTAFGRIWNRHPRYPGNALAVWIGDLVEISTDDSLSKPTSTTWRQT
jgi:hypothetical protein